MKYILILVAITTVMQAKSQFSASFGKNAVLYIVRHAEKQEGKDPQLTDAGNQRAGDLLRTLQHIPIKRIYVTEYRRTQLTADSMRLQLNIDTVQVRADTACIALFDAIAAHKDINSAIVIITHSNIIPKILYKLGLTGFPQQNIPDAEFDNLYIVRFVNGRAELEHQKYGKPSGASATMQ
jgi:broad specificity phosphatase PhoE